MLITGVIIDVYCDAAEGGDFGGEFVEAGVVLSVLGGEQGWNGDEAGGRKRRRTVRGRRRLTSCLLGCRKELKDCRNVLAGSGSTRLNVRC